jgi:hypothetical protein
LGEQICYPFYMSTAKEHYDNHLANFYSWMAGDFGIKQQEQQDFFSRHAIRPFSNAIAFDLGAGHGLQSVSLSSLGFSVMAVDFSSHLLQELDQRKGTHKIKIIQDDIFHYIENTDAKAELIVCMGDTLTHLERLSTVEKFIAAISQHLVRGGKVILSFRDLTRELKGEQRFIPVKSDDSRILTCFLEYFPDRVLVHDILQEKTSDGWAQKISAYPKLRISEGDVMDLLIKNDFQINSTETINRMIYIVAEKKI